MVQNEVRILFVPNERGESTQKSSRQTLADLVHAGLIGEVSVYSLLRRVEEFGREKALDGLVDRVEDFQPDLMIFLHPVGTGLRKSHIRRMRRSAKFFLSYYEGDPYGRWVHRLPSEAKALASEADATFTVGDGEFRRNFETRGISNVIWSPSRFDPTTFGNNEIPVYKSLDIIMIANRHHPRIRARALPGAQERVRLVNYMQDRFGQRFAIFGSGWDGPSARGALPFLFQGEAIASASITVNWDHFPAETKYFSNRLPISLAAGSIHVTGDHPGYDEVFASAGDFIRFGSSPEAIGDICESILTTVTMEERHALALAGRDWVHRHLRADEQVADLIRAGGIKLPRDQVSKASGCAATPLQEF